MLPPSSSAHNARPRRMLCVACLARKLVPRQVDVGQPPALGEEEQLVAGEPVLGDLCFRFAPATLKISVDTLVLIAEIASSCRLLDLFHRSPLLALMSCCSPSDPSLLLAALRRRRRHLLHELNHLLVALRLLDESAWNYQTLAHIWVYEGEREMTSENNLLGSFLLSGITPAPRGEAIIDVCFEVDVNGILNVTAADLRSGNKEKVTITNDEDRLSRDEVEKMIEDPEKFKLEDQEFNKKMNAWRSLDRNVCSMRKTISNSIITSMLDVTERKRMHDAIEHATQLLDRDQLLEAGEYNDKEVELKRMCRPVISHADSFADD